MLPRPAARGSEGRPGPGPGEVIPDPEPTPGQPRRVLPESPRAPGVPLSETPPPRYPPVSRVPGFPRACDKVYTPHSQHTVRARV